MSNFEILLDRPGDIIQRHVLNLIFTKKYGPLDYQILKRIENVRSWTNKGENFFGQKN